MDGDRILLIPTAWAPDPSVFEKWPALRVLMERLRAFLPLDILLQPSLKGQPREDSAAKTYERAIREQVRAVHHVLDLSGLPQNFLRAMADPAIRSLVVAGFIPSQSFAQEAGDPLLVTALQVVRGVTTNPAQMVPLTMQGADEADIQRAIADLNQILDVDFLRRYTDERRAAGGTSIPSCQAPALYLSISFIIPGGERLFELFRRMAPRAEDGGQLHEWPSQLQKESAGQELADKAIPFIERVIAEREQA
jgi:hypothetical protein